MYVHHVFNDHEQHGSRLTITLHIIAFLLPSSASGASTACESSMVGSIGANAADTCKISESGDRKATTDDLINTTERSLH